jgi:hypothetical protein
VIDIQNTDNNGLATFTNVPGGNLTLTEAIPTGYDAPIVFCTYAEGEEYQQDVAQGTIAIEYGGNAPLSCDWFNIPSRDGSITIYKYTCPAGYNLYLADDPKADCTDLTNGITFTLSGASIGNSDSTTGDAIPGAVYWGGLDPDVYTVDESAPAGTVDTRVFCQWYDAAGAYDNQDIQPYNKFGNAGLGGTIDLDVHAGDDIVCLWFNAPGYSGGELVVIKYWCDGNIYDIAHCDLYGGGADFELDAAYGGYSTQFTTGADGTAHLGLDAGQYALSELGRDWCRAESDQVDGDGYVVVTDGETSYVTVFNCGPGKKKNPPVKRFPNTGSGPVANVTVRSGSETEIALAVAAMILLASTGIALRRSALAA